MNSNKTRIKYITILAFIVAILSLGIGYSSYNTSVEVTGTSEIVESIYEVRLSTIHDEKTSNNTILYKQKPTITGNDISFSISNLEEKGKVSFKFDIENLGTIDAKVKSIKLSGLDEYEKSIEYKVSNLKIGDIIKQGAKVKDNSFTLTYKTKVLDQNGAPINLELENLVLTIELEANKE